MKPTSKRVRWIFLTKTGLKVSSGLLSPISFLAPPTMNCVHSQAPAPCDPSELLDALLKELDRAHCCYCRKSGRQHTLDSYWSFLRDELPVHLRPVIRRLYCACNDPTLHPFARREHVHNLISFLCTDTTPLRDLIPFRNLAIEAMATVDSPSLNKITHKHAAPSFLLEARKQHFQLVNSSFLALKTNWDKTTERETTLKHYVAFILGNNCWIYAHRLQEALYSDEPLHSRLISSYRTFEKTLLTATLSNHKRLRTKCTVHTEMTRNTLAAIRNMRRHAWEHYLFIEALQWAN